MQDVVWEREYRNPLLVTKKEEPQKDTLRFLKWIRRSREVALDHLVVLDLGCGTGRNSNYMAELDNTVTGYEISRTALELAKERAKKLGVYVDYHLLSMGVSYPLPDNSQDVILDVTSSNSLNEKEREVYLAETHRVLKTGGHLFVKTLCKDGDVNAKNLIKMNRGRNMIRISIKTWGL